MEINFGNKCRICLCEEEQMHDLFSEFDQGVMLSEILTDTTSFQIEENDGFPPYLCPKCTTIIVDFYNLKTIYRENQNHIKALLEETGIEQKEAAVEIRNEENGEEYQTIKIEVHNESPETSSFEEEFAKETDEDTTYHVKPEELKLIFQDDTDEAEDTSTEIVEEYQQINKYSCPNCGDCFLYEDDLRNHMLVVHNLAEVNCSDFCEISLIRVKKVDTKPPDVQITCKLCPLQFTDADQYKEHFETHKKYVCEVCGTGFIKKSYLKDHREVHQTERKHVCNFCNKAFRRRTVLVKHKRIHTHPRQCVCEVCGNAFNDRGTLKTHILLKHIKARNYQCVICGVKFPLKGTLEKHIRRHQNKEREFICNQCPASYKDKSSLDRHMQVKHPSGDSSVVCDDCGKQYNSVTNLSKHKKIWHNCEAESKTEI